MNQLSDDAKKQIEKMALKATERMFDMAVDAFKEQVRTASTTMAVCTGLHARAVNQAMDEAQRDLGFRPIEHLPDNATTLAESTAGANSPVAPAVP